MARSQVGMPWHECDPESCGIYYDPLCPLWFADKSQARHYPLAPDDVARELATWRSPVYRKVFRAALYELFREAVRDEVADQIAANEQQRRRDALSLKAHLASAGIKLEARNGKLMALPAEKITAEVKRAIADYRAILLEETVAALKT